MCVRVRDGDHALILDAGSGLRRAPAYLDGVTRIDPIVLEALRKASP